MLVSRCCDVLPQHFNRLRQRWCLQSVQQQAAAVRVRQVSSAIHEKLATLTATKKSGTASAGTYIGLQDRYVATHVLNWRSFEFVPDGSLSVPSMLQSLIELYQEHALLLEQQLALALHSGRILADRFNQLGRAPTEGTATTLNSTFQPFAGPIQGGLNDLGARVDGPVQEQLIEQLKEQLKKQLKEQLKEQLRHQQPHT